MRTNGTRWKRAVAAGLLGSALFAGVGLAAETRMKAERRTMSRPQTERARVVGFKTESTDSWLCENVSPFFCPQVPTVQASPQPSSARQRGRR